MVIAISFVLGVILGAAVMFFAFFLRQKASATEKTAMEQALRDAFANLSAEALSANTERFLVLAKETISAQNSINSSELDNRRQLIDQSIGQVVQRLESLRETTNKLEASRKQDYGQLSQALSQAMQQTAELRQTTENLKAALAHPQRRGQWGERMAADILQLAGMIEGANFTRQTTQAGNGRRPDFTFHLASGVKLNMDVKFPLDNYLRWMEAGDDDARRGQLAQMFCSDVRTQVRAIATKDYIDPAGGTADFALMFIPNEQMFAFIQELDSNLLRESCERRVIMVGPLSLLAVLAIVRQAAETANLSRQTGEAMELIAVFGKQWVNFKLEMDKFGQKLEAAMKSYESLRTTRSNMLERPLAKLEQLRDGVEFSEELN